MFLPTACEDPCLFSVAAGEQGETIREEREVRKDWRTGEEAEEED